MNFVQYSFRFYLKSSSLFDSRTVQCWSPRHHFNFSQHILKQNPAFCMLWWKSSIIDFLPKQFYLSWSRNCTADALGVNLGLLWAWCKIRPPPHNTWLCSFHLNLRPFFTFLTISCSWFGALWPPACKRKQPVIWSLQARMSTFICPSRNEIQSSGGHWRRMSVPRVR